MASTREQIVTRLAIVAALTALSFLVVAPMALAAPGVPAAPAVLYEENFENGSGVTELEAYPSSSGVTYSADSYWLNQRRCNGFILSFSITTIPGPTYCNTFQSQWNFVRNKTYALGLLNSPQNPTTNRAVSNNSTGNTDNEAEGVNPDGPLVPMIEFDTVGALTLPSASGRFVTFSVDAAATACGVPPLLRFYLRGAGGTEIPISSSPINPCTDPDTTTTTVEGQSVSYGRFAANGSILFPGSSLGVVMRNEQTSSSGNDGAIDNIRVLDATPTLDKSFAPATQDVGRPSTLTFTITNTSELAAKKGWSFTDDLPPGLLVANPANASTSCPNGQASATAGGTSVAMKGDLNADEASCTVSVNVTSSEEGTFQNCPANVSIAGLSPPACSTVKFIAPDVAVKKTMTPSPLVPGEGGEYHLKVTNKGPGTAEDVVVSDPLPGGVSFVSASPGCSATAGTVTCEAGSLAEGESRTFDVKVKIASSLGGCPSNTASVVTGTPDLNTSNNLDQVCPPVERQVDLAIEKTVSPGTVTSGGQAIYTLVVHNNGPSDASEVKVVDPGASGLNLVAANPSQGSCSIAKDRLSCSLGELASGGSAQILVAAKARINSGEIPNTATVSAAEKETDFANNQDSAKLLVEQLPQPPARFDLVVEKTAAKEKIVAGEKAKYTIAVTNKGPDTAPNVTLTDTFNHRATLVSVNASAGSCAKGLPLSCSLGDIASGRKVTITVVLKPLSTGCKQRNAASATGEGADAKPANNLSTADICVAPRLGIVKTADRKSVQAGGILRYTIRVTNLAKRVTARDVRTCDRLPSGLAFLGAKPRANLSRSALCWTASKLKAGKSVVYRVTVKVLPSARGRARNVASAAASGGKTVSAAASVAVRGKEAGPPVVTG